MLTIISSVARERAAFAALSDARRWGYSECDSIRAFKRLLQHTRPGIVLVRQKLSDGYSDDVIALLKDNGASATKIVVLLPAGSPSALEARQIALGAHCVQRDPVRTDVLVEYLNQYRVHSKHTAKASPAAAPTFAFAGATIHFVDRKIESNGKSASLTPRELQLAGLLGESAGAVLSYETLYSEILSQKFRGDTSNLRVLLGKLDVSARRAGIALRSWVEVIPKLGYRYRAPSSDFLSIRRPRCRNSALARAPGILPAKS